MNCEFLGYEEMYFVMYARIVLHNYTVSVHMIYIVYVNMYCVLCILPLRVLPSFANNGFLVL